MSTITLEQVELLVRQLPPEKQVSLIFRLVMDAENSTEIIEDLEDILAARAAKAEGGTPTSHEDFLAELEAEGLL